jgi:hypothetical protein
MRVLNFVEASRGYIELELELQVGGMDRTCMVRAVTPGASMDRWTVMSITDTDTDTDLEPDKVVGPENTNRLAGALDRAVRGEN